jgi:tetratricopeptide (TPR) repeat protein
MKTKKRLMKTLSLLTLLVFFFMSVSGCTTSMSNGTNFKIGSKGKQSGMNEQDVNSFLGKVRVRPGNPDSHYLLGCYYQERGKHREAISEFDKVIVIDPSRVKAYNGKGISHDRLGEYAKAVESYRLALSMNPKLDYVWNNLGYSYMLRGAYIEAASAYQNALDINDKEERIRNNMAMALAMAGNYEKAFREFERVGGSDRSYPYLKMASAYFDKAMFRQAIDNYKAALVLNPSSDGARKGLEASQKLLEIAEAAAAHKKEIDSRQALQEKEFKAESASQGAIASKQSNKSNALKNYKTAVRLYEKGIFNEATKYFSLAVKENPSFKSARKGLIASESLARIADAPFVSKGPVNKLKEIAGSKSRKSNMIGIEISNGNGARHMARNMAKYLKAKGFTVVRITNARHFNHAEGRIFFEKEYKELATKIASAIPHIKNLKQTAQLDRPNVKIKILVGKDMLSHRLDYRVGKHLPRQS